jgi:hypothetical protein
VRTLTVAVPASAIWPEVAQKTLAHFLSTANLKYFSFLSVV